ncbi:MAG: DUF4382 domain-containing protein [Bacteriovoracaceae bacterium]
MSSFLKSIIPMGILLTVISCGNNVNPSHSPTAYDKLGAAQGNLRLIVTDAPFSYAKVASAKVVINNVEVKSTADVPSSLLGQPVSVDLVKLQNGLVSVVVDLNLPAGQYKELNLISDSGSIDLVSGAHYNLKIPSGTSSGLKVKIDPPITITTQASTDILLDIDLSRSFVPQGDSKDESTITGFTFKPVARAANMTTAGTLAGKVSSDNGTADTSDDMKLAGAVISVSQSGMVFSTAVADENGNYKLIGLPAGTYSLVISSEGYTSSTAVDVSITAGNVTTADDVLLAKMPTP